MVKNTGITGFCHSSSEMLKRQAISLDPMKYVRKENRGGKQEDPKSIVNANVLVSYKQTALQGDNTTCLSSTG